MAASGYEVALPQVEVASRERALKVDLVFSLFDGYCAHFAALQQQGPHLSAYCRTYEPRPLKQAFKKHLRAVTPATSWSTPAPTDPAPPPSHLSRPAPPPFLASYPSTPLTPHTLPHTLPHAGLRRGCVGAGHASCTRGYRGTLEVIRCRIRYRMLSHTLPRVH